MKIIDKPIDIKLKIAAEIEVRDKCDSELRALRDEQETAISKIKGLVAEQSKRESAIIEAEKKLSDAGRALQTALSKVWAEQLESLGIADFKIPACQTGPPEPKPEPEPTPGVVPYEPPVPAEPLKDIYGQPDDGRTAMTVTQWKNSGRRPPWDLTREPQEAAGGAEAEPGD